MTTTCRPYVLSLLLAAPAWCQAPPSSPWSDKAGLSYVASGGNADSQSLGFSNDYKYAWPDASFAFSAGGVRVSTATVARSATGTSPTDYVLTETRTEATNTESYFATLRYDHKLGTDFVWFTGAGWERNRPAGLDNRYKGNAGLGYFWVNEERTKFRTDLGLGYTKEDPLFTPPGFVTGFATWNAEAKLEKKLFQTSAFTSDLIFTDALRDSQNYLAVWRNALTTNLSKRLALKVGYDLIYNNRPAFVGVDIIQAGSAPPLVLGQAAVPLKKLDTVFTTSLVITF